MYYLFPTASLASRLPSAGIRLINFTSKNLVNALELLQVEHEFLLSVHRLAFSLEQFSNTYQNAYQNQEYPRHIDASLLTKHIVFCYSTT